MYSVTVYIMYYVTLHYYSSVVCYAHVPEHPTLLANVDHYLAQPAHSLGNQL